MSWLQEYAKKFSEKEDKLKERFEALTKSGLTEEQAKRKLRLELVREKGLSRTPQTEFTGFFIGAGDLRDILELKRRKARKVYESNKELAMLEGLTDSDGIPLGKDGKPVTGQAWVRELYGFFKTSTDGYKFSILTINGPKAKKLNILYYKPCSFKAINKSEPGAKVRLIRASTSTKFVELAASIDYPQVMLGCLEKIDLADLDIYAAQSDFNTVYLMEADVVRLFLEPSGLTGSRAMEITDESLASTEGDDVTKRVWIPETIPIDFGEDSRVLIAGKLRAYKSRFDNTDRIAITACGIYPLDATGAAVRVAPTSKEGEDYIEWVSE